MNSDQPVMPASVDTLRNEVVRQPASQCRVSNPVIFILRLRFSRARRSRRAPARYGDRDSADGAGALPPRSPRSPCRQHGKEAPRRPAAALDVEAKNVVQPLGGRDAAEG